MSLNENRIILFSHLKTNWNQTEIVWGKNDLNRAEDLLKGGNPFLMVALEWDEEDLKSLNSTSQALFDIKGVLNYRIFSRRADGDAALDILTDALRKIYKLKPIENVLITKIPMGRVVGDGPWDIRIVTIEFTIHSIQDVVIF